MRFKLLVAGSAFLSISLAAHADTSTFDFTYSSTSGDVTGESATGSGSFIVNYDPGFRTGTLSAFSFTDTIDSSLGDSTFSYTGPNAATGAIVLTLGGDIAIATITTERNFGTDAGFGPVEFVLQDIGGTITGSTSAGTIAPDSLAGNTTGGGTVTLVGMTAPEPSSFVLLGTGLLGLAGMMKRRFA
jgi:hypothetical protein